MIHEPGYYIERISESALEASFDDVSKTTLRNTKNRILDLLGCAMSGAGGPGNAAMVDMVKTWGGKEESTIFIYGGKVPAHNAAFANSAMTRTYDFEAIGAFVEGVDLSSHISVTTVLTALAMGEACNVDGKELLIALLVGDDIAGRLLAASGFAGGKNFALGWDGNGTVNAFGAAAIAGRMLGLTKRQMQHNLGIVLSQMGGSFQNVWDGTICFKLPNALSAQNGIFSAELAKAGWDGPDDPLFSKFGYFNLFTGGWSDDDIEILTKDLGKVFYTEATFKPYSCCRANHAAIDCALSLISQGDIDVDNIDDVVLSVPPRVRDMFVGQQFTLRQTPQIDAAFSLQFNVANVLLRKGIKIEDFVEAAIREPEIMDLATKVRIATLEPDEMANKTAALKVVLKDGREFSSEVKFVKGGPFENSLTDEDIKDKFRHNLGMNKVVSKETGEKIIDMIDNLEEVDNISELTKLMV